MYEKELIVNDLLPSICFDIPISRKQTHTRTHAYSCIHTLLSEYKRMYAMIWCTCVRRYIHVETYCFYFMWDSLEMTNLLCHLSHSFNKQSNIKCNIFQNRMHFSSIDTFKLENQLEFELIFLAWMYDLFF